MDFTAEDKAAAKVYDGTTVVHMKVNHLAKSDQRESWEKAPSATKIVPQTAFMNNLTDEGLHTVLFDEDAPPTQDPKLQRRKENIEEANDLVDCFVQEGARAFFVDSERSSAFEKAHELDDPEIFYIDSSMLKTKTKKAIFERVGFLEVIPSAQLQNQKNWPYLSHFEYL